MWVLFYYQNFVFFYISDDSIEPEAYWMISQYNNFLSIRIIIVTMVRLGFYLSVERESHGGLAVAL